MPSTNASGLHDLFRQLGHAPVLEDKRRVREVKLFAPGWDELTTTALRPAIAQVKKAVLASARCGLSDGEIEDEIAHSFPSMPRFRVRTECNGFRVIVEPMAA